MHLRARTPQACDQSQIEHESDSSRAISPCRGGPDRWCVLILHGLLLRPQVGTSTPRRRVRGPGGATDFRDRGTWAPATVDRIIEDGEQIQLGDRVLTAHFTPGHTKGCTTWTTVVEENGRKLNLVVLGGLRVNNNEPLVNHPDYPGMPQDFAWSFARLKVLPVDIYLGAHGYWYNVKEKHDRLLAGADTNPFIDPEGYRNAVRFWEKAYLTQLANEGYGHAD